MPYSPEVIALYRAAPETFIAARDALVKDLRSQGREDEARPVKTLRKPTVVAWALNQLVERDPTGVDALLEAGAELRAAQRAALSGGDAERLRATTAARRKAMSELTRVAAAALRDVGKDPGPHVDAITSALEAAAVDRAAGESLRQGTFERPPRPESGFGDLGGLSLVPREPSASEPTASARPKPVKKTQPSELRELTRRRDAERKRADRERATVEDLARQIASVQSQLEKLWGRHREAEERAKVADLEARRAERNLRHPQD